MKRGGRFAVFDAPDDDALGLYTHARPERDDLHAAEFFAKGMNDFIALIGAVNNRNRSAGF